MKISRNRLKKCCTPTQTGNAGCRVGVGELDGARDSRAMNRCTDRHVAQALRGRDRDDQQHEPDRQQPQQVEPPDAADPHPRRDAVSHRHRTRPGARVDDVLAGRELSAVTGPYRRRLNRVITGRPTLFPRWSALAGWRRRITRHAHAAFPSANSHIRRAGGLTCTTTFLWAASHVPTRSSRYGGDLESTPAGSQRHQQHSVGASGVKPRRSGCGILRGARTGHPHPLPHQNRISNGRKPGDGDLGKG